MEAILAGIAGSTSLTTLHLAVPTVFGEGGNNDDDDDDADDGDHQVLRVAVCARLTSLSSLRDLTVTGEHTRGMLEAGDALALTALTGLTSLSLCNLDAALGDLEANALACNLTQLRDLDLTDAWLGDMVCLAAIARRTQLTGLALWFNTSSSDLTQRGLMMLTTLLRLQELGLYECGDISLDAFWAAVPGRQRPQPVR